MQDYTSKYLPTEEKALYKNKNKYIPVITTREAPSICLIGRTGSGKTNVVLYLRHNMSFDKLYICCKQTDEPVYVGLAEELNAFEDKLGYKPCEIHTLESMPECEDLDSELCKVVVFDDLVFESEKSAKMNQYLIAGRKKRCFVINLIHNWTQCGLRIRENSNCVGAFHNLRNNDLRNIYNDIKPDCEYKEFCKCYRMATAAGRGHFLFIDKTTNSQQRKLPQLRADMIVPMKYKHT